MAWVPALPLCLSLLIVIMKPANITECFIHARCGAKVGLAPHTPGGRCHYPRFMDKEVEAEEREETCQVAHWEVKMQGFEPVPFRPRAVTYVLCLHFSNVNPEPLLMFYLCLHFSKVCHI